MQELTSPARGLKFDKTPDATTTKKKPSQEKPKKVAEDEKKEAAEDRAHAEYLVGMQLDANKDLRETLTAYLQFKMK